jgi:hypothetical protein
VSSSVLGIVWGGPTSSPTGEQRRMMLLCTALGAPPPRFKGVMEGYSIKAPGGLRLEIFLGPCSKGFPTPNTLTADFGDVAEAMRVFAIAEPILQPGDARVIPQYHSGYQRNIVGRDHTVLADPADPTVLPVRWDLRRNRYNQFWEYIAEEYAGLWTARGFDWSKAEGLGVVRRTDRGRWVQTTSFNGDPEREHDQHMRVYAYCRGQMAIAPHIQPIAEG